MKVSKKSVFACLLVMLMSVQFNAFAQEQEVDSEKEVSPKEMAKDSDTSEVDKVIADKNAEDQKRREAEEEARIEKIKQDVRDEDLIAQQEQIEKIEKAHTKDGDAIKPSNVKVLNVSGMPGLRFSGTRYMEGTGTGIFNFKYRLGNNGVTEEKLKAEIKNNVKAAAKANNITLSEADIDEAVQKSFDARRDEIDSDTEDNNFATFHGDGTIGVSPFKLESNVGGNLHLNGGLVREYRLGKEEKNMIGGGGNIDWQEIGNADGPTYGALTANGNFHSQIGGDNEFHVNLNVDAGIGLGHMAKSGVDFVTRIAADGKFSLPVQCKKTDKDSQKRCLEIIVGQEWIHLVGNGYNIGNTQLGIEVPLTPAISINALGRADYITDTSVVGPKNVDGSGMAGVKFTYDGSGAVNRNKFSRGVNTIVGDEDKKEEAPKAEEKENTVEVVQ